MSGEGGGMDGVEERKIVGWMKRSMIKERKCVYERKRGLVDIMMGRIREGIIE